jgi:hypothetical protein
MGCGILGKRREDRKPGDLRAGRGGFPPKSIIPRGQWRPLWTPAAAFARDRECVLPAISRPWRLHLNFLCRAESNGGFSAIKLIARISGTGHYLPVGLFLHSGYSIEAANSSRLNLSFTETTVTEATAR